MLIGVLLLAGTVSTLTALTNGAGHILRPGTWTLPAILQAVGIAAMMASFGLPHIIHDATAGLMPAGTMVVAAGAGLAMFQRRRRENGQGGVAVGT